MSEFRNRIEEITNHCDAAFGQGPRYMGIANGVPAILYALLYTSKSKALTIE